MKIIFTDHAEDQIEKRNLLRQEVIDAVKRPDFVRKKYGKYFYHKKVKRGEFQVVCENTETHIKVIMIYWS